MLCLIDYHEIAGKINPVAFSKYLEDTGWLQFHTKRKDIRIFQKDSGNFFQVTVPMDDHLADYKTALYEACKTVAEYEKRSLEQLFLYLLNPGADILKIRIEKKEAEPGNILLDDAIGVYENAKKLLGAAAQDVLKPATLHQGRMDTKITSFLSNCRFGQTEVGSYVISVICPMTEDDDGEIRRIELFEDKTEETNFTRQITRKVIRNIQKLKSRIDDGQYNLAETSKEDGISANFSSCAVRKVTDILKLYPVDTSFKSSSQFFSINVGVVVFEPSAFHVKHTAILGIQIMHDITVCMK